jgi:hypothetical protein
MNCNLKFAIAAAIASLGVAGQAHALTNSTATTSGSLFLYVFEDRQANPAATNTAIFDLGLASAFDTTANQTIDLSATAGWTNFVSGMNLANVHWGVFGSAYGNGGTGTQMMTTMVSAPTSVTGTTLNTATTHYNGEITLYGSNAGFNTQTINDLASSYWDNNASQTALGTLTTGLGGSLDFYKWTSTGTKASQLATETAFATGGNPAYFTLDGTGHLAYTAVAAAPVPEADSYAMMLAGLGLVGFMVRRRKAV